MKLVYGGDLWEHGTALHRLQALERLGFDVHVFDFAPYMTTGGPLARRLRLRLLAGGAVARCNRDFAGFCAGIGPDFIWLDKPLLLWPDTVSAVRRGGAVVVTYISDNPFSTLFEPWFRLIRRAIARYDVSVVPRPTNVAEYRAAGAATVVVMPFAFDPLGQFPEAAVAAPTVPLSFIGAPYGKRPEFLTALAGSGLPVLIRGERWRRVLPSSVPNVTFGPPAWDADYRRAIRSSAICLSFVTHHNHDPWAHKSIEIAACGTFLLAERTDGHAALFDEGREAEFFGSVAEAADKACRYLAASERRQALALAGCRRAWTAGYSNDERLAAAFAEIDPALGRPLTARARAFIARRRAEVGLL